MQCFWVSPGADRPLYFVVERVDYRIQLFQQGNSHPLFVRTNSDSDLPARFPLCRQRAYTVLFDNNDSGLGFARFFVEQLIDGVNVPVAGSRVDISADSSPTVMEFPEFMLQDEPSAQPFLPSMEIRCT